MAIAALVPLKPMSNGPKASASMSISSGDEAATPETERRCSHCKTESLPIGTPFYKSWCDACRQIMDEQSKKHELKYQKTMAKLRAIAHPPSPPEHKPHLYPAASSDPHTHSAHKSPAYNAATLSRKRTTEEAAIAENPTRPTKVVVQSSGTGSEYQTEDALLDALAYAVQASTASGSSTAGPSFKGNYTVVLDPAVPSEERVARLVSAYKRDKRVSIGKLVKRLDRPSEQRYSQSHWCICKGVAPPPPAPAPALTPTGSPANAPLKRSQSTLMRWFAAGGSAPAQDAPGRGVCGGTIEVEAAVDFSHPLARKGIKGQRVTVRVRHPAAGLGLGVS